MQEGLSRYHPDDLKQYARFIDKGHVLRLDEDGRVDYFALEVDNHNGPMCLECQEFWCEHCDEQIKACPGSGPRLAREAEAKRTREKTRAALKAWDNVAALEKRLAELKRGGSVGDGARKARQI